MCTAELGATVTMRGVGQSTPGPGILRHFYEIILVGESSLMEAVQRELRPHAWRLGTVDARKFNLRFRRSGSENGLHSAYQTGWRKHFALLA